MVTDTSVSVHAPFDRQIHPKRCRESSKNIYSFFWENSTKYAHLYFRHINIKNPEKTAIASYMLSDVPSFMDSLLITTDNQVSLFCYK